MAHPDYELVIGTKSWSSWSLRPWIAMRHGGLAFRETRVALRRPDTAVAAAQHSPSAKVPVLKIGDEVIWDSLAILETLAERHPEARLWPEDPRARAIARAISAEMHSGFTGLRQNCPMDFGAVDAMPVVPEPAADDLKRIVALWRACRQDHAVRGPFLLGAFSNADAMYAPVVSRIKTYIPDLAPYGDDGTARAYVDWMWELPAMRQWGEEARAEGV